MADMYLYTNKVLHMKLDKINTDNGLSNQYEPLGTFHFYLSNAVIRFGVTDYMVIAKDLEVKVDGLYGVSYFAYTLHDDSALHNIAVNVADFGSIEFAGVIDGVNNNVIIDTQDVDAFFNNTDIGNYAEVTPCYILLTTLIEEKTKVFKFCGGEQDGQYYVNDYLSPSENTIMMEIYTGEFTTIQSMMNPVIQLQSPIDWVGDEYDNKNIAIRYNYAYVSLFNRFYFINDVVFHEDGLMDINLNEDVLFTYCLDIKDQKGRVIRSESTYTFGAYKDNVFPIETIQRVEYRTITNGALKNITFDTSNFANASYLVVTYPKDSQAVYIGGTIQTYSVTGLPVVDRTSVDNPYIDVRMVSHDDIYNILKLISSDSSIESFVANISTFPLVIPNVEHGIASTTDIIFGDETFTPTGTNYKLYSSFSSYWIIADFYLEENDMQDDLLEFLKYSPYRKWELFIPYYGFKELDVEECLGTRLVVFYINNYLTGDSNVYLYDYTNSKILFSAPVKIGSTIPYSVDNSLELYDRKQRNDANLLSSLIGGTLSSALTTAGGVASGNPVVAGGGLASLVVNPIKSFVDWGLGENELHAYTSPHVTSGTDGMFDSQSCYLKITYFAPQYVESMGTEWTQFKKDYLHMYGAPCNKVGVIGDISSGFTIVDDLHYTAINKPITSIEIEEIINLAKGGIIL